VVKVSSFLYLLVQILVATQVLSSGLLAASGSS